MDSNRWWSPGPFSRLFNASNITSHPSLRCFWGVINKVCGLALSCWSTTLFSLTNSEHQPTVNSSLLMQPIAQENHPGRPFRLGHCLGRFPFPRSWSFLLDIVWCDLLFVASQHPLQEFVTFVPFQLQNESVDSVHLVLSVISCGTQAWSIFCIQPFADGLKWFCKQLSSSVDVIRCYMSALLNLFHALIRICLRRFSAGGLIHDLILPARNCQNHSSAVWGDRVPSTKTPVD